MFRWFVNWCMGSRDYRVPERHADCAASLLITSGADPRSMRECGGCLCFTLPLPECAALERIFASRGIEFTITRERGLRFLLRRYSKRPGILVGLLIFFVMIGAGRQFIWTLDVAGNENVSANEILSELESLGCRVGTYIPGIDFDRLHSDFLLADRRFAWIAVNLRGTHATVEVRESLTPPPVPDEDTPYNLVADEEGFIESVDIYRGAKTVSVGDPVRKGDLLASGVVETKSGFKLVHARGVVKARVRRSIHIEIPLEREKKVYTGREFAEKSLKILGFSIKVFKSTGNPPATCDIIDRERRLSVFGTIELPIVLSERVLCEYELSPETISGETARSEAFAELRDECSRLDGEIVSREVEAGLDGGVYTIDCKLAVVRDIAREIEIYR